MEIDLEALFIKREELMRDKWTNNRLGKLVCRSDKSRTSYNSKRSVFVDDDHAMSSCLHAESLVLEKYGNGETIFHLLARECKEEGIKNLLSKNFEIGKDDHGLYPWHVAVLNGNIKIVEQFIKHGFDITEPSDHYQFSLIHFATLGVGCTEKQADMIRYILQRLPGIDIDAIDMYGRTALFCAGQYRKYELGKLLLSLGANPEVETHFNYCVMSISLQNCPDLALSVLDWALEKEKKEDKSRSIMRQKAVWIIYNTKVDPRIMLHPYIGHIIGHINSGKTHDYQIIALLAYMVGVVIISWLCMTNEYDAVNFMKVDSPIQILYRIGVVVTMLFFILDIYQGFSIYRSSKVLRQRVYENQSLANYLSSPYHPDISADKSGTKRRAAKIFRRQLTKILVDTLELAVCVLGRATVIACQFMSSELESNTRDYLQSTALVVIWWEFYRKILWLTIIPNFIVITGLVIQRCMLAILDIMLVASIIALPFLLIVIRVSIRQQMAVYVGDGNTSTAVKVVFAFYHMFKVLTMDNYHDYDFEEEHSKFFIIFYPVCMTIFSLVILNMCIGKLSIEYKNITDNAQYEINRQRLFIKVEWDADTIVAERIAAGRFDKIKSWFTRSS